MKIGFIGAGKVGFTLGRFFTENGRELSGYYSRSLNSAKDAASFTGSQCFETLSEILDCSDVLFITVPDREISQVYEQLSDIGIDGKLLVHCSGAMTAGEAFTSIEASGAKGLSIHPLFPVSSRYESYLEIGRAFFCIEGDRECAEEWSAILKAMGCRTRLINGCFKSKYHLACAIASNLVCGLLDESVGLLTECGFNDSEALAALRPLAECNLQSIFQKGTFGALTGPVERNDIPTVQKHLMCLEDSDELEMYKAVSRRLVKMAEKYKTDEDYSEMKKILE